MNVVTWILAGGIVGWIACSTLHLNSGRGLIISAIIGVIGAFFGGHVLTPLFGGAIGNPGDFSSLALLMALVSAIACLKIGDLMYERFGV